MAEGVAARGKMKLELAQRLLTALGSEGKRWTETVASLESARELLVGDALLAAAFILSLEEVVRMGYPPFALTGV